MIFTLKHKLLPPDQQPIGQLRTYLDEAAHHMISEHGQTGPALAVHVDGVDRHDDRLRITVICHQDADPAVAEADRVVRHPKEWFGVERLVTLAEQGVRVQKAASRSHLGPPCSSRWTLQAGLTGSGRIRTVTVSKVTSARYSFTRGLKEGVRVRGGSV